MIVDTNIIFSAIINPYGKESNLFLIADEGLIDIIICDYVLDEARAIFERKNIDSNLLINFLDTFQNISIIEIGELEDKEFQKAKDVVLDEKDRPIFVFAYKFIHKYKHAYLVTGDKHLRTKKVKEELKELSMNTSEFFDLLFK